MGGRWDDHWRHFKLPERKGGSNKRIQSWLLVLVPHLKFQTVSFLQLLAIKIPFALPKSTFSPSTSYNTKFPKVHIWSRITMARGNRSSFLMGLSALFYLVLLFSPLAYLPTASAETDAAQDPLQESYGVGKCSFFCRGGGGKNFC